MVLIEYDRKWWSWYGLPIPPFSFSSPRGNAFGFCLRLFPPLVLVVDVDRRVVGGRMGDFLGGDGPV